MTALAVGLIAGLLGAAARPANAVQGDAVAQIAFAKGVQVVDAQQFSFPAEQDLPLLASDKLKVDATGLVLVLLKNNYLVRIDADLELAVTDIALLNANRTEVTINDQLNKLLVGSERNQHQISDRLIGWHVGLTGATPPTPQAAVATKGDRGAVPSPPPMPPTPPTTKQPDSSTDKGGSKNKGKNPPVDHVTPARELQKAQKTEKAPIQLGRKASTELSTCLGGLGALDPKLKSAGKVSLRFRQVGEHLVIWLEHALPVPACAYEWLKNEKLKPEGEGWERVEVPLK